MKWSGQKVVVIGLGASGLAAARLLYGVGAEVTVRDESDNELLRERANSLQTRGIHVELGKLIRADETRFDFGVLSPGIDPRRSMIQNLLKAKVPIWSELELAYRFCQCPLIAITGTNGKTTTTELVHAVLTAGGKKSCAAGNIGLALSEVVHDSDKRDVTVVEASSFQLEQTIHFHPKVAALLNISPDHMDRYDSMSDYFAAKLKIFRNQAAGDLAIVNASFGRLDLKAKTITFSARGLAADYTLERGVICYRGRAIVAMESLPLRGLHNAENIMVAIAVAQYYGIEESVIVKALINFRLAPHRCEWVGKIKGVTFINDSKATNVDAMAQAIESFPNPIVLIAGGKDKGFEFDSVAELVAKRTRGVVLIGETASKLKQAWEKANCLSATNFQKAFDQAVRLAQAGDVVLLSPGCSSFDMFRDYADRGNQFKAMVQKFLQENIG
ncbi:MAG: UDP-N-acetylmuramoyl-L-alanine--D-glutamate ligase [Verrucomicrobiae bacterium]|nr:UDP-N-acetylmuramoyl-L-alanine--D-glutamate ligase [Verrucomicrobiae bacterium]